MRVKITAIFDANVETVWMNLQNPKLLDFVANPLVKFQYLKPNQPKKTWEIGEFTTQMKLFGVVPMGKQTIRIEVPENNTYKFRRLRDNGSGEAIQKWDHWIEIEAVAENKTKYTDEIIIEAGIFTRFVWCFAYVFYTWRQFRWKKLISHNFKQLN